jgi:hypothetical protein
MKHHDSQTMYALYEQWLSSGQCKADFARQHQLSLSIFYYWISKFERKAAAQQISPGFSPIMLEPSQHQPASSQPLAIVRFPAGTTIEFYTLPSGDLLKTLCS